MIADEEDALLEARLLDELLRLLEELAVVLRLDLELLAERHRRLLALARDVDDLDDGEVDHRVRDALLLAELRLLLEVAERRLVVGRVGGDGGDDARALLHRDGEERERLDRLERRLGRGEREREEVLARKGAEADGLACGAAVGGG
jgi:hypothetical protein